MLYGQAKEIVEEIKELKTICMKAIVEDIENITDIDYNAFKALKSCMDLLDKSCDYMLEQARMMEDMNNKLDDLLAIARKGS